MSDLDKHLQDLLDEADVLFEKDEYAEAIRLYKEILQYHPIYWDAWYQLGYAYMNTGEYSFAVDAFKNAIMIEPSDEEVYCQIGYCYAGLRDMEEAENYYKLATLCAPEDGETWYQFGYFYDSLQNEAAYRKAQDAYRQAIHLEPTNGFYWFGLGLSYYYAGDYVPSLEAFDHSKEFNPHDHKVWINRGMALERLGRSEEAIQSYIKGIELEPQEEAGLWNLANLYVEQGNMDAALTIYDQLLYHYPDRAGYWNSLSILLSELERYREAEDACYQAILLDSRYAAPWNNKGIVLERMGLLYEATNAYDQALIIDPTYWIAHTNRSHLFEEQQQWEEALVSLDRMLEIDADQSGIIFRKLRALLKLGKNAEAMVVGNRLIQLAKSGEIHTWNDLSFDGDSWYKLTLLFSKMKQYDWALTAYDKAIAERPALKKWYSPLLQKWWKVLAEGRPQDKRDAS
jgi:tetratricopeptide (TPR) repeat protein